MTRTKKRSLRQTRWQSRAAMMLLTRLLLVSSSMSLVPLGAGLRRTGRSPTTKGAVRRSKSALFKQPIFDVKLSSPYDSTVVTSSDRSLQSYIRWHPTALAQELQTKVTTFHRMSDNLFVELHAMVHFGDVEYFDFFNNALDEAKYDAVLYELLVDDSLVRYNTAGTFASICEPLSASPSDRAEAQNYNWACQVDCINYSKTRWFHADWTMQRYHEARREHSGSSPLLTNNNGPIGAAMETTTALLQGPPILSSAITGDRASSSSSTLPPRRLFTNLFISGERLARAMRQVLWWTVPTPEVFVLLLDWSTFSMSSTPTRPSQTLQPIVRAALEGNMAGVRRLLFGQVLVSGRGDQNQFVQARNAHALSVLWQALADAQKPMRRVALLYGCAHCPDSPQMDLYQSRVAQSGERHGRLRLFPSRHQDRMQLNYSRMTELARRHGRCRSVPSLPALLYYLVILSWEPVIGSKLSGTCYSLESMVICWTAPPLPASISFATCSYTWHCRNLHWTGLPMQMIRQALYRIFLTDVLPNDRPKNVRSLEQCTDLVLRFSSRSRIHASGLDQRICH